MNQWHEALLTAQEAGALTNDSLPLFVLMTCLNGYFHDALADSLAESLMKAERGGGIVVWASSGMTLPEEQTAMNKELFRLLFGAANASPSLDNKITIGEATRKAKSLTPDFDVRRTWILLGDPTIKLK